MKFDLSQISTDTQIVKAEPFPAREVQVVFEEDDDAYYITLSENGEHKEQYDAVVWCRDNLRDAMRIAEYMIIFGKSPDWAEPAFNMPMRFNA